MFEQPTFVQHTVMAVYVAILVAVAFYGLHRYVLVYLYIKYRNRVYLPKGKFDMLPKVTVQLPMFNEDTVAERIIRATCQIDYPLDRLEIQVLDDSTDHSADIARQACEQWAAKGYPIKCVHRTKRTGYKAGALADALPQATGDFIAIFDADFVPPRDILQNVIQYFTDDKIGMVQVRWDHLNRDASVLTNCQAIFLDGHFVIEHTARNRSGRFMHFNGTAGVWRRTTIDDAGGWEHDTLTEDLDLSYRAQLKGWQFVYCPQFCAPAELPPEMISFKQQAHRWTKGSMQTAIKLLPRILRSKHLSYRIKTEAFFHLSNTIVYPLMVLLTLLMYPVFFGYYHHINAPLKEHLWGHYLFSASLFVLATCSASTFFVFGQRELLGKNAGWKTILYLPFLMALGVGVGLNNAKAVFEAIWSAIRRKPSEFVRTPKYGVTNGQQKWRQARVFTAKKLWLPILEIAFGTYMASCILISLWYAFGYSTIPFLMIFAGGYYYVGFSSLYVLFRMHREAEEAAAMLALQAIEPAST
ncbi:MAG TPA: glycosyltransferase [Tepidisphaeraceae bacterium]|jgi:cellulose synthase/poly-beta-1,6-N-acetylglucosamine synthase-like glycosyltransferase